MRLSRRFIAAAFVAAAAAGCSTGETGAVVPAAPSSSSTPPPTSSSPPPAPFVAAASPAHLSAACPFLGPAEFTKILNDGDVYASSEVAPERQGEFIAYKCEFHLADGPHTHVGTMEIGGVPAVISPQNALKLFTKTCVDDVQTLYEAAMYCDDDGNTDVVVVKPSHGEIRLVEFQLNNPPDGTRRDEYTALAKTVENRL